MTSFNRNKTRNKTIHNIESKYKVFVFDLDNTLYLHNSEIMHRIIYHKQVKIYLQHLKNADKILCLATHNKSPFSYLNTLGIAELFHHIIIEKRDVHPWINHINDYTGKDEMIKELISKIGCTKEEIVFFDDASYNTIKVESIGVKSILVSNQTGIEFTKLSKDGIFLHRNFKRKLKSIKDKIVKKHKIKTTLVKQGNYEN